MNGTQDITVTRGETITIGNSQYYTRGQFPTATIVTVNGEPFLEIDTKLYTWCGWCDTARPGTKTGYGHVFGGVCFQCNGRGYGREVGTVEDAAKIARRRATDRARRERKAAEKAAAEAQAGNAWRAANPFLADLCEAIYAEMAEAGDATTSDAAYYAREAVDARWGEFVTGMANLVGMGRALTENQTAATEAAIEKALIEQAAEAARQNASRYYGVEGGKVAGATGTVVVAVTKEVDSYTGYGTDYKRLVIIEGTGEFAGVTFKIWGTGKTLFETNRGDVVEVKGGIKGHGEREGIKQTELTRATIKVVAA